MEKEIVLRKVGIFPVLHLGSDDEIIILPHSLSCGRLNQVTVGRISIPSSFSYYGKGSICF